MNIEIVVPAAGESVTEADVARWFKEDGEFLELDEPMVELETDKASLTITAPAAGILHIKVAEDETVNVGDVIAILEESAASPASSAADEEVEEETDDASNAEMASPAARKLIAENSISAQDIPATGKDGRITKEDVIQHLAQREKVLNIPSSIPNVQDVAKKVATPAPVAAAPSPAPVANTSARGTRTEKMSRLRRTIAQRLVDAQQEAAILSTFNEVDMSAIMDLRKQHKDEFKEKNEIGLGFMSFFTKATAIALKEFPIMNAQVDGSTILYHDYVDMGIAVSTPKGLVVPVIRDCDELNFSGIEKKIRELALKGRDMDLTPEEMTGGTFTITNGGSFGSMLSTPILNRPQSAILGMHNIVQRPMAVNGKVEIRPIMYLAVSYDHRIIDGSDAVRFLVKIKTLLEDPTRILLEL
ncbi:2-oxoglutarate dehydrogenase complex dihydrolipoyllysine-residue succinyltransferase [Lentisphaera profundi]|uniref:Dihydrolipoyllysine-residue succinyltransferase component of 2-oxoglutarate dehydrogenase complex n=1 Tax=Lentisphaera profundi TaxID=1658616 RepID=A0ABY7VRZ0_9BACT|nr:2-oxoglutarate dehydrogenase complex dihydrolipoyllysine-residue succinyltransferase [Lentisphaera profundi]WDE96812.1 2-oxoglutarate dehydrogenase complex dihydrolipoyllysine-residue succinyltransferase [Lentisphaera profundi]